MQINFPSNAKFGSRFAIGLVVLCALALTGCSDSGPAGPGGKGGGGKPPGKQAAAVEVSAPEVGTAASYYVTTATLEPSSDAEIYSRTAGVVRKIYHEEGDDVKAGDILLQLEDDDQKLRLKQARQTLDSTKREFTRLTKMRKAGAVGANEWEDANRAYLQAKTDLELAELAFSYTRVAAPFDGRVVWREVDLGSQVLSGKLLFRVMAIYPLLLKVHVPASIIGKVAPGQAVALDVDSADQNLAGEVSLVSPIVDPDTGTIKVTVTLKSYPANVRPGDFTQIRMVTDSRDNAFLLPSVALIEERGDYYLFVEEEGKAVRRDVEVGYVVNDKTEVISGLSGEDKVIVKGQRNLNDGNPVKVVVAEKSESETKSSPRVAKSQDS